MDVGRVTNREHRQEKNMKKDERGQREKSSGRKKKGARRPESRRDRRIERACAANTHRHPFLAQSGWRSAH